MMARPGRHVRQVDRFAGHVELPAVVDTTQPAFLVAAEKQVGAAVRTVGIDEPDSAPGITERDELLA